MSTSTPPPIFNPLRILVLTTSPSTPLPPLLQGSDLPLDTPYYSATVPTWHDTIASLQQWENEWLAPEAGEVIQSIGAWVVVLRKPACMRVHDGKSVDSIRTLLTTLHSVISHHQSSPSTAYTPLDIEPLLLAIGMPQPLRPLHSMSNDEWEDLCRDCGGWEWIDSEATGKNEFGENVGLGRLKEALEANEWDGSGGGGGDVDADEFEAELGLRGDDEGVTPAAIESGSDFAGMHEAILGHGGEVDAEGDIQVEELESMMLKMQAIKEKGAAMPEDERKRFAATAVSEVIKTIKSVS